MIGIAGPSCAGKTELARRLADALDAPIVALDSYYYSLDHLPLEQRARSNFDVPDALDAELLVRHVGQLARGEEIQVPVYDFSCHQRTTAVRAVRATRYALIEGLFTLHWEAVRELLAVKLYVGAGEGVCLRRRIERDVRQRQQGRRHRVARPGPAVALERGVECRRVLVASGPVVQVAVHPYRHFLDRDVLGLARLPEMAWARELPHELHVTSAGVPLRVMEALRYCIDSGLLARSAEEWQSSNPAALHSALQKAASVERRISSLTPGDLSVLLLIGIAGMPVPRAIIVEASTMPESQARMTIADLEMRGLVTDEEGSLILAHDTIGDAIMSHASYEDMLSARRKLGNQTLVRDLATLNAPFGQSTWRGEHCLINPQTGQVGSGVFTLTRADGMQATGTYVGTVAVEVAPGGQAPLELTLTISGGTGQLLTANGSGSMKVTLTPGTSGLSPWPFSGTIEGTIVR